MTLMTFKQYWVPCLVIMYFFVFIIMLLTLNSTISFKHLYYCVIAHCALVAWPVAWELIWNSSNCLIRWLTFITIASKYVPASDRLTTNFYCSTQKKKMCLKTGRVCEIPILPRRGAVVAPPGNGLQSLMPVAIMSNSIVLSVALN